MKKNWGKQVCQWALALLVGFLIVNGLCFAYERQTGWLDTPGGPSASIWRPGTVIVHGTEGYGISRVDENGYLNPAGDLADTYVLMMGASHTQGKEIPQKQRYSTLVSDYFSGDSGLLSTYNIASDGHFLTSQIRHFAAAVAAFPDAGAITMELGSTDASPQELRACRDQAPYTPAAFDSLSTAGRLKLAAKEGLPLLNLLRKNIQTMRAQAAQDTGNQSDYEQELDAALSLIRSEFDGPIAFVYHPTTKVLRDGTLVLGYSDTWDVFCRLCEKNGIDVIDTGPRFRQLYETEHRLPYGFANTTPGDGHLNAQGHRILAEEIISYLEELRV